VFSSTISSIQVHEPNSWVGQSFLTIDVDWAHDDIIMDTVALLEAAEISDILMCPKVLIGFIREHLV
jgi:hypothetical protein